MTAGDVAAWADRKMGGRGAAPMSIAGPGAGTGAAHAASAQPAQPAQQQPAGYTAAPSAGAAPAPNLAALAAVPQLANLLPQRPNPFGLKIAPFSLRG
jgi:hypothetical protein